MVSVYFVLIKDYCRINESDKVSEESSINNERIGSMIRNYSRFINQ